MNEPKLLITLVSVETVPQRQMMIGNHTRGPRRRSMMFDGLRLQHQRQPRQKVRIFDVQFARTVCEEEHREAQIELSACHGDSAQRTVSAGDGRHDTTARTPRESRRALHCQHLPLRCGVEWGGQKTELCHSLSSEQSR